MACVHGLALVDGGVDGADAAPELAQEEERVGEEDYEHQDGATPQARRSGKVQCVS